MSHEITGRDNVFSVREPIWWAGLADGAATVMNEYPTRDEAQAAAHPWEPVEETLYRRVVTGYGVDADGTLVETVEWVPSTTTKAIVRSDDSFELGGTSLDRPVITNSTMYDIAEALQGADPASVKFETGGSLQGGRKVWLLLALAEPIQIPGDPNGSIHYFCIQNHHVNGAFKGQGIANRPVCANTVRIGDHFAQSHGTEFTFSHTKNVGDRIEEAKQALAMWCQGIATYVDMATHLASVKVTDEQVHEFAERFIPMPREGTLTDRVRNNVIVSRQQWYDFLNSPTCEDISRTGWGLVQASTEYLQWGRKAHRLETLFARTMLNRQDMVKKATDLVGAVTGA